MAAPAACSYCATVGAADSRCRKRWCTDCHSLEVQLKRNVGSLDLKPERLKDFFTQGRALKAAAPNSRLSWKTVRACLKESMIRQRTHRIVRESSSEGRPLEYWTRLGYAEDEVRKCPQEVDAVMGTTLYKVTARSTSAQQIDEEVEQTILDKEKNCARQRKKGKGEEPEGEAAWDVPDAEAAGKAQKGGKKKTDFRRKRREEDRPRRGGAEGEAREEQRQGQRFGWQGLESVDSEGAEHPGSTERCREEGRGGARDFVSAAGSSNEIRGLVARSALHRRCRFRVRARAAAGASLCEGQFDGEPGCGQLRCEEVSLRRAAGGRCCGGDRGDRC